MVVAVLQWVAGPVLPVLQLVKVSRPRRELVDIRPRILQSVSLHLMLIRDLCRSAA